MTVLKYTLEARQEGAHVYAHLDNGTMIPVEGTRSASGNGVKAKTLEGLRKHGTRLAKYHSVPFEEIQL